MDDKALVEIAKRISKELSSFKEKEGESAHSAIVRVNLELDEIKRRIGSHSKTQEDNMKEIKSDLNQIWSKLDSTQNEHRSQHEKVTERVHKLEVDAEKTAGKVNTRLGVLGTKITMIVIGVSAAVNVVVMLAAKFFDFFKGPKP